MGVFLKVTSFYSSRIGRSDTKRSPARRRTSRQAVSGRSRPVITRDHVLEEREAIIQNNARIRQQRAEQDRG